MQSEPGPIAATTSGVLGRSSEQSTRTSDGGDWRPTSPQIELVAKLQRQLQSKDAEITALKVSCAAERGVLRTMLAAVDYGCTGPHPATHGLVGLCCRSKYSSSRRLHSTPLARPSLMATTPYSCPQPSQNVHLQHNTVSLPCDFHRPPKLLPPDQLCECMLYSLHMSTKHDAVTFLPASTSQLRHAEAKAFFIYLFNLDVAVLAVQFKVPAQKRFLKCIRELQPVLSMPDLAMQLH